MEVSGFGPENKALFLRAVEAGRHDNRHVVVKEDGVRKVVLGAVDAVDYMIVQMVLSGEASWDDLMRVAGNRRAAEELLRVMEMDAANMGQPEYAASLHDLAVLQGFYTDWVRNPDGL